MTYIYLLLQAWESLKYNSCYAVLGDCSTSGRSLVSRSYLIINTMIKINYGGSNILYYRIIILILISCPTEEIELYSSREKKL